VTIAQVRVEHRDGLPVAFLGGEVDAANAPQVTEELMTAVTNRAPALVLVLSDTRYLDSAGINLLFQLNQVLESRRQRLGLVLDASARLRRVLEISGVFAAIAVWEDLDSALTGIGIDE
jgi:anti-sigma B factor antagonist